MDSQEASTSGQINDDRKQVFDDEASPKSNNANETYVVEDIVDKKVDDGEIKYFVKWEGYPDEDNTWERIGDLGCCWKKIESYERKIKQQCQPKPTSTRRSPRKTPIKVEPESSTMDTSNLVLSPTMKFKSPKPSMGKKRAGIPMKSPIVRGLQNTVSSSTSYFPSSPSDSLGVQQVLEDMARSNITNRLTQGEKPISVCGMMRLDNQIHHVVMFENNSIDAIPTPYMRQAYPQLLIDYYERKLQFEEAVEVEEEHNNR